MKVTTDVDIDVADRDRVLSGLPHINAYLADVNKKHTSGVYFQPIPNDPVTGLSTIDYKEAEELGYMKLDILNVSMYEGVRDESHLQELIDKEPSWRLLEYAEVVKTLFHISNHSELVTKMKPKSVEQLAMVLAVIRPSKYHLRFKTWSEIEKEVWIKPTDGSYHFKKAHAVSYALAISVQMNLLEEQQEKQDDIFSLFFE